MKTAETGVSDCDPTWTPECWSSGEGDDVGGSGTQNLEDQHGS